MPGDSVLLMTLHNAKGLEFPVVFMTGLNEGLCPYSHKSEILTQPHLEEERRLVYVGMTRAKERLFWSLSRTRRLHGASLTTEASRFIEEIPEEFKVWSNANYKEAVDSRSAINDDLNSNFHGSRVNLPALQLYSASALFNRNDRIIHPQWGAGTVLSCVGNGMTAKVTVLFDRVGTKKLLAGHAKLQKLN